jgi:hypothetical protein
MFALRKVLISIIVLGGLNCAQADEPAASAGAFTRNAPFAGTFYGTFSIEGVQGFAPPTVLIFHADGTWTGVDAGDFGTLAQSYETAQHGTWQRTGARTIVAVGLILRFYPSTGQLTQVASPRLEIAYDDDFNELEATAITERHWFCYSPVSCPDPFTDAPNEELDLSALGIGWSAKRFSP